MAKKIPSGATSLSMLVAQIEGKAKQVNIAQIREVVGIIGELSFYFPGVIKCLLVLGERRASKPPPK